MLELITDDGAYYRVRYPDVRGLTMKSNAKELHDWLIEIRLTGESIVQTATQLLGIPYLWGGTSVKGLDCSGFTKHVYFMHGIILARTPHSRCVLQVGRRNGRSHQCPPGDLLSWSKQVKRWVRRWCTWESIWAKKIYPCFRLCPHQQLRPCRPVVR